MKIINYNYGWCNKFNCCIRGKIIVSKLEWKKYRKYLLNPFTRDPYLFKNLLKEDFNNFYRGKEGLLISIRVAATTKVVEKFGTLKNNKMYKRNNYMFLVKN